MVFAEQAAMEIHALCLLSGSGVPYVAHTRDWFVDGDRVYILQQRYRCSLYDLGKLSEEEVKSYVAPILLHLIQTFYVDYNLLHADIKAANVLLDNEGAVALSDFNSVHLLYHTAVSKGLATRRVTVEDEVRDLGVMLVKALTGERVGSAGDHEEEEDDEDADEDEDEDDDEEDEEDPRALLASLPSDFSSEGKEALEQMLSGDPQDRNPQAIMFLPWFAGIDWQTVELGVVRPPASLAQRVMALNPPPVVLLDDLLARQQDGLGDDGDEQEVDCEPWGHAAIPHTNH